MNHARALSRLLPARWRPRAGRFRPRLEWLEGRCLPAFLTVTSAADDGTAGTLRVVLGGAQNGDTVGFDPSLVGKTIGLTSGAININTSLDIVGPGVTVSGSNLDRVFVINGSSGQGITVGLTGLTITGGRVVNGSGGGIENVGGNLTLTDCAVIGNTAVTTVGDQSLAGGGIDSFAGVTGSLDIEACLIANNSVSGPGGGAGGGVAFGSTGETLTIHDSTFTGNSAPSQGGALFWSGTGTRDLRDSTFSDNMAPNGGGGGIFAQGGTGEAVACTVVFNRSEFQDAGFTGNGLTLDSSIVAGNIASGVPSDVGPGITSSGHNLILAPGAKFVPGPGDVIGQGPLLGPLADNGGPTPTRALLAGGPGLGAGDPALAGTTDQRGSPRPAAPDIGAYQTEPAVELLVEAPATTAAGAPFQATVEALDAQGNVASTFTGTVTFSSNDPQATLPAGYTFVSADGGVHNFAGLVLRTAGNEAVFVADAAAGFNAVAQLQVLPGPAAAFTLSGLPSPDFAGQPAALTVTARDQFGNVVPAYAGTVHFSSTDPAAVLPPDFTFTQADAGAHTFPVTLSSLGPRSVTVTDTSAGITGSASTTVQAVTLLLSGPSQVQAGNPLVLTVTTSPAGAVVNGLTVHWGDGTQDGFAVAPTTVTHVYPQGPNYVGVTLTAITPTTSSTFNVVVLVPQVGTVGTGVGGPTQTSLTAVVPSVPGVQATLTAPPPHGVIHLLVAVYGNNPTPVPKPNAIFYDVVVNGAGPDDRLDVVFHFPPGKASAELEFFDPSAKEYRPVRGSEVGPVRIDLAAGTATVTLDRGSLPTLLALSGTVFAIVLPAELPVVPLPETPLVSAAPSTSTLVTATLSPSLAANGAAGLGEGLTQAATFQAGTSLTLTLSPSAANRVVATQSTANSGEERSGEDDVGPWWRMFRDLFASAAALAAELPLALAAAPTEGLSCGALDALFGEAGGDGAAEIDLLPREGTAVLPEPEAPADDAPEGPDGMAWLLAAPLLALGAGEPGARREGEE